MICPKDMYSFEGEFKRRPVVSLRGASKKEETSSLLQRTQHERLKREEERRKQHSATIIQSFVRGSLIRLRLKAKLRNEWDAEMGRVQQGGKGRSSSSSSSTLNAETLLSLQSQLILFFREDLDSQRLIILCQTFLKHQHLCVELLIHHHATWLHQIRKLLLLCCRMLGGDSHVPIAVPLRMLEVFTEGALYQQSQRLSDADVDLAVSDTLLYLVQNGYYRYIRILMDERLPPGIEYPNHPPLAETTLQLVYRPSRLVRRLHNQETNSKLVLRCLCRELLCPKFSESIGSLLLPAVIEASCTFPVSKLLQAIVSTNQSAAGMTVCHLHVDESPWLLYSVMTLVPPVLTSLDSEDILRYLYLIKLLLPTLPSASNNDDDSDHDLEEEMETSDPEFRGASSLMEIRDECLQILSMSTYAQNLLAVVSQSDISVLTALCSICHTLMVKHSMHVPRTPLLYLLAFNERFLRHLWEAIKSVSATGLTGSHTPLIQMLSSGYPLSPADGSRIIPLLSVFSSLFGHLLLSLHDAEFHGDNRGESHRSLMPFQLDELVHMSLILRNACLGMIESAHPESRPSVTKDYRHAMASMGVISHDDSTEETALWMHVFKVTAHLVKQLHDRDMRRSFCPPGHWLASHVSIFTDNKVKGSGGRYVHPSLRPQRLHILPSTMAVEEGPPPMSTHEIRKMTILAEMPFVIPFEDRVKIFRDWIHRDKEEHQGEFAIFTPGRTIDINVRRDFIYEDAYDRLRPENEPSLKKKLRVVMRNVRGLEEAGIDGGGLTREFLSELLKTGFDPNRGFFKTSTDELLYPNPQASQLEPDYRKHYYFLGRMLGKVLYENLLVELPFASFFLTKLLSKHADVDIDQLASLDPEVYKNLLSLKDYTGDVADLNLDFTVVDNDYGATRVNVLKAGGQDIPVTATNRIEYIHLMADYRLNKQMRPHILAFRQGLANVIDAEWLQMFDHQELQVLISGALVPIDLDDLKRNTKYSGGYTEDHPLIETFWKVVDAMDDEQKRALLKFVTSCSRPPLLGFKELYPPFCIQYGGSDEDRLPSASTCMNLLKLPEFKHEEMLRTKLLYAIDSGAGFELS
ncbi:ubiquitin-protein ligase E3C-like [Patiria miniata]|uniref:Ubiquitin-protein ligase E3C n=1 Tax=Patiria miniata TaxID=46514 RepID=A0A913ZXU4_PATMI|nr:ubiquitin-protein ligase E3C-like [Patiria miniata]